jgi:hypothetical protein
MSEINFLGSEEEKIIKPKPKTTEPPATKWTSPGVFRGVEKEEKSVEDIFADTDNKQSSTRYFQNKAVAPGNDKNLAANSVPQRPNILSLFSSLKDLLFAKKGKEIKPTISDFRKNKETLRDYQQVLQTETVARKTNPPIVNNAIVNTGSGNKSGKQYFRRDEWHAPNVIKTNLIQTDTVDVLDWSENINMMLSAVFFACLLIALSYLGLEIKESLSAQKSQEINQKIQEVQMQILSAKSGLGDIDTFQKKLETASTLLSKHIYWTNFFQFWEDNLLKNVYFSGNFSGDTKGKYSFTVVTDSYTDAANQIKLLRTASNIDGKHPITDLMVMQANYAVAAPTSKSATGKGTVNFGLQLTIDPSIFYKKN